ncbi:MAG TPA: DUF4180 domain-containing protein [Blastocatellia bacterium]|nr:DUF4180 domain-containing protein [Blastocatellia bacterium]
MQVEIVEKSSLKFARITSVETPIGTRQDALEIVSEVNDPELVGVAIDERCFHPDFFNLKTGLAGEILQMFTNYQIRAAIIGDFSGYQSGSLHDLIIECNRGRQIFFVSDMDQAIEYLSRP